MIKHLLLAAGLGMIAVFTASTADAAGFGLYGSLGSGSSDWNIDALNGIGMTGAGYVYPTEHHKTETTHGGGGLVYDTAVAKDTLFNYQLAVGYDAFRNKDKASGDTLANPRGLAISNAFGFGIVRTGWLRLWIGPELRLGWQTGDRRNQNAATLGESYDLFSAGIGPVLGMNFNLPGSVTIAVKAGYQFTGYYGQMKTTALDTYADVDVDERFTYVAIGFLFRTESDKY